MLSAGNRDDLPFIRRENKKKKDGKIDMPEKRGTCRTREPEVAKKELVRTSRGV